MALLVGWAVLGSYRRELAAATDALGRYAYAIPVLKAYYASDASICGERLCVNVDPNAQRQGNKPPFSLAIPLPSIAPPPMFHERTAIMGPASAPPLAMRPQAAAIRTLQRDG